MKYFCKKNPEKNKFNGGMNGREYFYCAKKMPSAYQNMKKRKFGEAPQIVKKSYPKMLFRQMNPENK